jgi:hypothetical protein
MKDLEMFYDRKQLIRDLDMIAQMLGERQQYGFFMINVFERDGLRIRSTFDYNGMLVEYRGKTLDFMTLDMTTPLALYIMRTAITAEEIYCGWIGMDPMKFEKRQTFGGAL